MTKHRKQKRNFDGTIKIVMLIIVLISFIMALMYIGPSLNLSVDTTTDFIDAIPGIFVFTLSVIFLTRVRGVYAMVAMLGMGSGLAILIYTLYNTGLIIDGMLWGLTVEQNMALIIVLCGIIGGIMVATDKK